MIIRQALKDDLNDICALSNEIYGEHFESMPDTFCSLKVIIGTLLIGNVL